MAVLSGFITSTIRIVKSYLSTCQKQSYFLFPIIFRWGFTPLIEAERFQHDFVFRYLAKHVEDNYPEALEELLKKVAGFRMSQIFFHTVKGDITVG